MAKREVKFESQDRRIAQINKVLNSYGIASIEEAEAICDAKGIDPYLECEQTQNICFENAKWAYVVGAAIAIKKNCIHAADAAEAIGEGLQAFCIPGSVADDRKVGLGHGNLAARLLREETQCFAFLAGHESFAAAEGAIKIAEMANKVRKNPLRVILNGLGKDAAMIISRINGFTPVVREPVRCNRITRGGVIFRQSNVLGRWHQEHFGLTRLLLHIGSGTLNVELQSRENAIVLHAHCDSTSCSIILHSPTDLPYRRIFSSSEK